MVVLAASVLSKSGKGEQQAVHAHVQARHDWAGTARHSSSSACVHARIHVARLHA